MIKASINVGGALRVAKTATKQVRYAAAQALTAAAKDYAKIAPQVMRQTLDRPMPFTQRGVRSRGANSSNLQAAVYILPIQSRYLRPQIEGGSESGEKPYPFKSAENVYGNLPRGATKRAKAFTVVSRGDGEKLTFVRVRSGKRPAKGAYRRKGSSYGYAATDRWRGLKLIAGSTTVRHYRAIFPFYERAQTRCPIIVQRNFNKLLRSALAGARW